MQKNLDHWYVIQSCIKLDKQPRHFNILQTLWRCHCIKNYDFKWHKEGQQNVEDVWAIDCKRNGFEQKCGSQNFTWLFAYAKLMQS